MAKSWKEVEQSDGYQDLGIADKKEVKKQYWDEVITSKDEFGDLKPKEKKQAYKEFFGEKPPLERGERSLIGNVFERPGAAVRSGIIGAVENKSGNRLQSALEGYRQGANIPEEVERFQEMALDKYYRDRDPNRATTKAGGLGVSTAGLAADIVTNPADMLLMIAGKTPMGGGSTLGSKIGASKLGQVVKGIGEYKITPIKSTAKFIKRYGSAYIKDSVVPKAVNAFKQNVDNFTVPIQRFAKTKLKFADDTIKTIKDKGVAYVNDVRAKFGDSTDTIYQRVLGGFGKKQAEAGKLFDDAWGAIPNGSKVNPKQTFNTAKTVLTENGLLDANGVITEAAKNPAVKDSTIGKVLELYKLLKKSGGENGEIPKEVLQLVKSTLDGINADSSSYVKFIKPLRNSLYDDAAQMGTDDIHKARAAWKKMSEMEERFMNRKGDITIGEKKLDRYQSLSKKEIRDLRDIENYTGVFFADDVDSITASRAMDKFGAYNEEAIARDLEKAISKKDFNFYKKQYSDLFGDKASEIFKDIKAFRKATVQKNWLKWVGVTAGGAALAKSALQKNQPDG